MARSTNGETLKGKTLPMMLSGSRALCGCFLLLAAVANHWLAAWLLLVVGFITDMCDGTVARALKVDSNDGRRVDMLCDLILTFCAIAALTVTKTWPLWPAGALIALFFVSVAIYVQRSDHAYVRRLKKVQYFVHTIGALVVFALVLGAFSVKAFSSGLIIVLEVIAAAGVAWLKRRRIREFFASWQ